jgi:hypothetical protein
MSRETAIGIATTAPAVVAMVFDHLIPDDPVAFVISVALSVAVAAFLFLWVIPRTKAAEAPEELAAKRGLIFGLLAVPALVLVWVGIPFPVAGGAIALGLIGRRGPRRRRALVTIVLGIVVLLLATAGTDWGSSSDDDNGS